MFEWLWKSKEWVFSGVGVPIVVGIFLLFRDRILRKDTQPQSFPTSGISPFTQAGVPSSGTINHSERSESRPSGNEIVKAVDGAPPFQRDQVAANYVGLIIRWPVILIDLCPMKGTRCKLTLAYGNETWGATIELMIDIDEHPRLKSAYGAIDYIRRDERPKFVHGWLEGKIVECRHRIVVEPTWLEFFD